MSNSIMRQSTTTTVNTRNATHNDSDFDALLEDLQATVSRSNSFRGGAVNGGVTTNVSGYREVRRTVKDDATGESTTEYHIEYLHPANSTTHVSEYSTSPYYNHTGYGVAGQHNKEISYKYNNAIQSKADWSSSRSRGSDAEVEELLQDFQTPLYYQNQADRYQVGVINPSGFDNVPGSGRTVEERRFREERRETRGSGSNSLPGGGNARRELVFTGPRSREPSPSSYQRGQAPVTQQVYRYEKTTSTKTIGPDGTILYDSGGNDGGKRPYPEEIRTVRSPSPQYLHNREPSPGKYITSNQANGSYSVKQSNYSYNTSSSNHQENRDVPRTPPPHRSPSPVSFNQPPTPVRSSVSRTTTANYSYDIPSSPTLAQKFSPSDPTRTTLTYNVSPPQQSVSSYKYSTTTTSTNKYSDQDLIGSKPRPFPTPSPTPDQQPPKKLDELMASLGDIDPHDTMDNRTRVHTVRTETTSTTASSGRKKDDSYPGSGYPQGKNQTKPQETQPLVDQRKEETKNITGPPVYYPKGELFAKKEESMVQRESAGGGGKYKAKAKYQYESGSKYKESSDTKVVPVCVPCPCCCAAPCTIM